MLLNFKRVAHPRLQSFHWQVDMLLLGVVSKEAWWCLFEAPPNLFEGRDLEEKWKKKSSKSHGCFSWARAPLSLTKKRHGGIAATKCPPKWTVPTYGQVSCCSHRGWLHLLVPRQCVATSSLVVKWHVFLQGPLSGTLFIDRL